MSFIISDPAVCFVPTVPAPSKGVPGPGMFSNARTNLLVFFFSVNQTISIMARMGKDISSETKEGIHALLEATVLPKTSNKKEISFTESSELLPMMLRSLTSFEILCPMKKAPMRNVCSCLVGKDDRVSSMILIFSDKSECHMCFCFDQKQIRIARKHIPRKDADAIVQIDKNIRRFPRASNQPMIHLKSSMDNLAGFIAATFWSQELRRIFEKNGTELTEENLALMQMLLVQAGII